MKLSFESGLHSFSQGQTVRGEVVGSDDSGSLVVVNGLPVVTSKKLEVGKQFVGNIDNVEGRQATISVVGEGADQLISLVPEKAVAQLGLSVTEENLGILAMLRRFGLPSSLEWFQKIKNIMQTQGVLSDKDTLEALGLLLSRGLSKSALSVLKEYVSGGLRLGSILSKMGSTSDETLKKDWLASNLLSKLVAGLENKDFRLESQGGPDKFPTELASNLLLQEILSVPPDVNQEGRLYFQWPIFWSGQDVPDTLEGEAFFQANTEQKPSFSLRILVEPPRLGALEIGIHRISDSLWTHFGVTNPQSHEFLNGIFTKLSESLRALGWKSVRLTSGPISQKDHFLAPRENAPIEQPAVTVLDIKV